MTTHVLDQLSDYIDDELGALQQAAVSAHLSRCADCARTADELRRVKARAAALEDRPAHGDVWAAVARGIGVPPVRESAGGAKKLSSVRRTFRMSVPQLLAASLALAAVSGGGVWVALRGGESAGQVAAVPAATAPAAVPGSGAPAVSPAASAGVPVRPVHLTEHERGFAAYDSAVADLHRVIEAGRGRLRPTTVRTLEANLKAIDRAIADVRQALRDDPASAPFLDAYLRAQMKHKLDVMRQVAEAIGAASTD